MSAMSQARAASEDRPQEIVERGLQAAQALAGCRGCAVLVEHSGATNLRWAMNGLSTNGVTSGQTVTVVVGAEVTGGIAAGVLTRPEVGLAEVPELVADAYAAARAAAPAEDAAPFVAGEAAADWEAGPGRTGPEVLAEVGRGLGEVFKACTAEDREWFGYAAHAVRTLWLGTSAGTRLRHEQPTGSIEVNGKSHQRSRSTWIGQATRDFSDVDVLALDAEVRTRLGWQHRKVDLPAGRYDTVLPPTAVADLMVYVYWSSDARSAHEGRTVFSRPGGGTRVGERLTPRAVTLRSDPAHPGLECADRVFTAASSPFASVFDNGLVSPATTWVDAGVLAALPTTRHSAALTGLPLHPAVGNLVLDAGGTGSVDDLVAGLDRGLLVTCLFYIREVDPMTLLLTGLTRDGVYLVEGGEVAGAVTNFRFNDSPVDLLARVRAAGAAQPALSREWGEYFGLTAMPALAVEGFNMSSVSEAS